VFFPASIRSFTSLLMSAPNSQRDRAVQNMFDRIAGRYDLLNRVISFRLDVRWRYQAIRSVLTGGNPIILDIGTGTGDLAFNAVKESKGNARIVGLDFSLQMLKLARSKQVATKHGANTTFVMGSATASPFKDSIFDGAMTAFVLRNVSDLSLLFAEAFRMLKPGAKFVSLDMFPPSVSWFSTLYAIYFYRLMPRIGGLLSRDRSAYRYLSESVRQFQTPENVEKLIERAGFANVATHKFMRGAVCMHVAEKSPTSEP
jgi:demethylmenaquinone methyltransferase / 2-methoxy-6-polyprenyl-1,4-benzoquinol methylase